MTDAAACKKPTPRTVADLNTEVARLERALADAQRARDAARTSLPDLIAEGDGATIAESRREISLLDVKVREVKDNLEQTREAIQAAAVRDRAATDAQSYRVIKRLVADARQDVEVLADAIEAFCIALKRSGTALDSVDALLRRSGVTPDPYVLRARLVGLVEMALHLESGGLVGAARTLDNPHQLRQNGRASLKQAASEFQTLTMQRVRGALHLTQSE